MILQALTDYYDRLPEGEIAPLGYVEAKVSFCLVIDAAGELLELEDIRDTSKKKPQPQRILVPDCGGRSSGIKPFFLWDKTSYVLGYDPADTKPLRTIQCFKAFRDRHLALRSAANDEGYSAFCNFLERWNPEEAKLHAKLDWERIGTGANLAVRVYPSTRYLHTAPLVRKMWANERATRSTSPLGECLVSGHREPISELHAAIKGVLGGQSSGAPLISFNLDAFTSYGKEKSDNAPVGEESTFKYTTALNQLLSKRRIMVGDASTVFWSEGEEAFEDAFLGIVEGRVEDPEKLGELNDFVLALHSGSGLPKNVSDAEAGFYVLGLSPNAARISIRFWWANTVGEAWSRLQKHFEDLSIERSNPKDRAFPGMWELLYQTARDRKDIPPQLAGELMRSVLTGAPYPDAFFQAVIRRIRADKRISYLRVASIKAYLKRKYEKDIPMSLDLQRMDPAYLYGRLFAALEKAQDDAQPGINATIKDRFFSSACSTPAAVFPRLLKLNQHHVAKLDGGMKVVTEKRIQSIMENIDGFPNFMPLEDQGIFAIGYYHQRNYLFKSKKDKAENLAVILETN